MVGDCAGGEGDGATQFAAAWDHDRTVSYVTGWYEQGLISGSLIDVDDLVGTVDAVLRSGPSLVIPSIVVAPRPAP